MLETGTKPCLYEQDRNRVAGVLADGGLANCPGREDTVREKVLVNLGENESDGVRRVKDRYVIPKGCFLL